MSPCVSPFFASVSHSLVPRLRWEWGHPAPAATDAGYAATVDGAALRSCDTRDLEPVLFLEDCSRSDPRHRWTGLALNASREASTLFNEGTQSCVGNSSEQPIMMGDCGTGANLALVNGSLKTEGGNCLDAIHGFK